MYNPYFIRTHQMCRDLADAHYGEMKQLKLAWGEIKSPDGNIVQIVPLLDITFKF